MWSRRRFLARSGLALFGTAGAAFALPTETRDDLLPDGSASRGMITPKTDEAIAHGLAFLARGQLDNGGFGTNFYRGNVAVTSLAGLAFMAGGHQPGRGPYGKVVERALSAVLDEADHSPQTWGPGFLYNQRATPHGPMYGHGFGTLFLAEAYGMVSEPRLRERLRDTLQKAVELIVNSPNEEGGWRYLPNRREADVSVTICQIMALRAARNAGLYIPKAVVDGCVKYIKDCRNPDGSFRYQRHNPGGPSDPFPRTAAGVCALYSAGIYSGPEIETGLRYLLNHRPTAHLLRGRDPHYFYGHYYAAQAMWTAGGTYWAEWFPFIRDELINSSQLRADGSWYDPLCAHYGTAMACIILQIPNNYLPILQK